MTSLVLIGSACSKDLGRKSPEKPTFPSMPAGEDTALPPAPAPGEVNPPADGTGDSQTSSLVLTGYSKLIRARENEAYTITFESLKAAANLINPGNQDFTFSVGESRQGSLKKNGKVVTNTNFTVEAGEVLTWMPPRNRHGLIEGFTLAVKVGTSSTPHRTVSIQVEPNEVHAAIDRIKNFLTNYTRIDQPSIANKSGLIAHAFHDEAGRLASTPSEAGTIHDQALMLRGLLRAYDVTGEVFFRDYQRSAMEGLRQYFPSGAPNPNSSTPWLPHELINVKKKFHPEGPEGSEPQTSAEDMGHLTVTVPFTNGVTLLPRDSRHRGGRLARVTRAFAPSGSLEGSNIFSPVTGGATVYTISYYIDRNGYKIEPQTNTRSMSVEMPGKIVLSQPINGDVRVVYTSYSNEFIDVGQLFETYPATRALIGSGAQSEIKTPYSALPLISEIFALKESVDPAPSFDEAGAAISRVLKGEADVHLDIDFVMRQAKAAPYPSDEKNPLPLGSTLASAGVEGMRFEGSGTAVVQRNAGTGLVEVSTPGGLGSGLYSTTSSSWRVQDTPIPTTLTVKANASTDTNLVIEAHTSYTPDPTQIYRAAFIAKPSEPGLETVEYERGDFLKWTSSIFNTMDHEITLLSNGDGDASNTFEYCSFAGYSKNLCAKLALTGGNSGSGGAELHTQGGFDPTLALNMAYALDGDIKIRIEDSLGCGYSSLLPQHGVVALHTVLPNMWTLDDDPEVCPAPAPAFGLTRKVELWSESASVSRMKMFFLGNSPLRMPSATRVYRTGIGAYNLANQTVRIGDVRVQNAANSKLKYVPGVVPYELKSRRGVIANDHGAPNVGDQSVYEWIKTSEWFRVETVYQFWKDAQDAYAAQSSPQIVGPFAPIYLWDHVKLKPYGNLDSWSWFGPFEDPSWGGYQARAILEAARGWHMLKDEPSRRPPNAEIVVMRFLVWLKNALEKTPDQIPSRFPSISAPQSSVKEPYLASLYLKAALYAKDAGADPIICDPIIKTLRLHLLESVESREGTLYGAPVSKSEGEQTYGFWIGEALDALALSLDLDFSEP